jgi:hypothetical protein
VLSAGVVSAGVLSVAGVASGAGVVLSGVPPSPVVVGAGSGAAGGCSGAGCESAGAGGGSVGWGGGVVGVVCVVCVVCDGVVSAGGGASCANAGRVDHSATAVVATKATPKRRARTNRFPLAANGVSSRWPVWPPPFLPQFAQSSKGTLTYERLRRRRSLSFLWIYERRKQKSARDASIGRPAGRHECRLSTRVGFLGFLCFER